MSITTAGGLTVTNIQSKAGFATSIHVKGIGKQCDILFDCGVLDEEMLSAKHIFISHGHIDHIGACLSHARARSLRGPIANYYVPVHCFDALNDAKRSFEALEGKEISMNIIPMELMSPVSITPYYKVYAFPTMHRVPSQGYGVVHRKVGGLLPEYHSCTREELAVLRREGAELNIVEEKTELVYTGDTTLSGLLLPDFRFVLEAELLLLEMTYLDGDLTRACAYGHVHLDEFVDARDMFQNRQIIFVHLSAKYYPPSKAISILRRKIPPSILDRCAVGLRSFGYREAVTLLDSSEAVEPTTRIKKRGAGDRRGGDNSFAEDGS